MPCHYVPASPHYCGLCLPNKIYFEHNLCKAVSYVYPSIINQSFRIVNWYIVYECLFSCATKALLHPYQSCRIYLYESHNGFNWWTDGWMDGQMRERERKRERERERERVLCHYSTSMCLINRKPTQQWDEWWCPTYHVTIIDVWYCTTFILMHLICILCYLVTLTPSHWQCGT